MTDPADLNLVSALERACRSKENYEIQARTTYGDPAERAAYLRLAQTQADIELALARQLAADDKETP